MSANSTYGLKTKIGSSVPFFHKKNNSYNFSLNTGRLNQISKKYSKNKKELKNYQTNNSKFNIVNHSNYIKKDSNISKLLTSINKNNKKIELNFNKYYSPTSRLNKSNLENIILFKKRQYPSQTNINNKMLNKESYIKDYNINNNKVKSVNKSKKLSNINININISKKIISTYYNKSKSKNNIIIKKKSIYSLKNNESKERKNKKYIKINNLKDIRQLNSELVKNQSSNIVKKFSNKNVFIKNNNINDKENNKNSLNLNSLGHFSTNSNMSTNTNKNNYYNKKNINNSKNNFINYTSNDIFGNSSNDKENNNNNKAKGNIINKIIKDNKSKNLSQIKLPIHLSGSPRNFNNIQNYLKYLKIRQSPQNRAKNQKLSYSNINYIHNNTESNTYENIYNNTFNYECNSGTIKNYYKYNKKYLKAIPIGENKNLNSKDKSKNNILVSKRNKKNKQKYYYSSYENREINDILIECPEELHYYFVKIFQTGKSINFEHKK